MIDLLLIEPDAIARIAIERTLAAAGLAVSTVATAEEGLSWLCADFQGVVLADSRRLGASGMGVLEAAMHADPHLPVVLLGAVHGSSPARDARCRGASEVVMEPYRAYELVDVVRRALRKRRKPNDREAMRPPENSTAVPALLGESPSIQHVRAFIAAMGPTNADILILGQTGTGKEIVARQLHAARSPNAPFVAMDCAAMSARMFESDLFGNAMEVPMASAERRTSKFELALSGTLFIDEIDAMPLVHQAGLLQAIETRLFAQGGDTTAISFDCRVVAASKANLAQLTAENRFHPGLFERLSRVRVCLPTLREHPDDMPLLLGHFVCQACLRYDLPMPEWTPALIANWTARPWPGNVRELKAFADQLVLGLTSEQTLDAEPQAMLPMPRQVELLERLLLRQALDCTDGNVVQAADRLGISRSTLYEKLKRYQISV